VLSSFVAASRETNYIVSGSRQAASDSQQFPNFDSSGVARFPHSDTKILKTPINILSEFSRIPTPL